MLKKLLTLIILGVAIVANVNAKNNSGYVHTRYGEVVKNGYGQCLHTGYYDSSNGLAECGEDSSSKNNSERTK